MNTNQPLSTGTTLEGRYRIRGVLGQGGMSRVYLADALRLEMPVAIKENLQDTPEARQQFENEARLLARLAHPNVPRVLDSFTNTQTQRQYLVMEYVEGEDLAAMIKRVGPLPEAVSLAWIRQILDAVEYLHAQNPPVIHRDIKPANIKITPQGKAVLVDFGISKFYDPSRGTVTGMPAVTAGFAPPEQYGFKTTQRSDVYALGATLYTMLTGKTPPEAPLRQAGEEPLVLPGQLASVSEQTEGTILRALEVENTRRWQSVGELRAALEGRAVASNATEESQTVFVPKQDTASSTGARSLKPILAFVSVIAIAILGILAFMVWRAGATEQIALAPTVTPTATWTYAPTPTPIPPATATATYTPTSIPTSTATMIPTATRVPTTAPTSMFLLEDDFLDNKNGWWESAMAYFENGKYFVRSLSAENSYWITCLKCGAWADFVYEAQIAKVEGSDSIPYGLVFRDSGPGPERNLYSFHIMGYGIWGFDKMVSGQWRRISTPRQSTAIKTGNSQNKLRAVCRGSKFEFFINDQSVGTATDDALSNGNIGAGVTSAGTLIRIDYVRVWRAY
jgi:serine/threonine-protein kinase